MEYTYDSTGRKIDELHYSPDGSLRTKWIYNTKGPRFFEFWRADYWTEVTICNAGGVVAKFDLTYDAKGRLTSKVMSHIPHDQQGVLEGVYSPKSPFGTRAVYVNNSSGKKVEELIHAEDGTLASRKAFNYDQNRNFDLCLPIED
jgi:hypothetical protein